MFGGSFFYALKNFFIKIGFVKLAWLLFINVRYKFLKFPI
jgi:hypothetical protein